MKKKQAQEASKERPENAALSRGSLSMDCQAAAWAAPCPALPPPSYCITVLAARQLHQKEIVSHQAQVICQWGKTTLKN